MVMKMRCGLATPGAGGVLPEGMRHQILKCEHEMSPEPWVSVQVPIPISSVCVMCLCCLFVFLGVSCVPLRSGWRVECRLRCHSTFSSAVCLPELNPPLETQVLSGHCARVSLRVMLLRCGEEAAA